jgi:hypothetical protein
MKYYIHHNLIENKKSNTMTELDFIKNKMSELRELIDSNLLSFDGRFSKTIDTCVYTFSNLELHNGLFDERSILPDGYNFNMNENNYITGIYCTIYQIDDFKKFIKNKIDYIENDMFDDLRSDINEIILADWYQNNGWARNRFY